MFMIMLLVGGLLAGKPGMLLLRALPEPPLVSWTEVSPWSLVIPFATGFWGLFLMWLLPRVTAPRTWVLVSGCVCLSAFAYVQVRDSSFGVAVYPDRFVYRFDIAPKAVTVAPFADVRAFRSSCVFVTRGQQAWPEAMWEVELASGDVIDLSSMGPGGLGSREGSDWVDIMRLIDQAATRSGAMRQSSLHKMTGAPLRSADCEAAFAGTFDPSEEAFVRSLFRRTAGAV